MDDPLPPEDELVAGLINGLPQTPRTLTGPGDDCAVIRVEGAARLQLFKADAMVEGVHFTRDMPAAHVGRKALARAVSDIAAMGGRPCEALVTLILPPDVSLAWVEALYQGLKIAALAWETGLAGGETCSAPAGAPVVISIALTGESVTAQPVLRSGARVGEVIAVTGRLGNSFASGWHLDFTPRLREAWFLTGQFQPGAMMDLSDGLAKDLPRLALSSGVGWELDLAALPLRSGATRQQALTEGEDYELLFTLAESSWEELAGRWPAAFPGVPLTRLGRICQAHHYQPALSGGWDHFAQG